MTDRLPGVEAFEGALYGRTPIRLRSLAHTVAYEFSLSMIDAYFLVEKDEKACKMAILDVRGGSDPYPVRLQYGLDKWLR